MQWICDFFGKCLILIFSISKKCLKFIASKMLEIKSQHLTWGGPKCNTKETFVCVYIFESLDKFWGAKRFSSSFTSIVRYGHMVLLLLKLLWLMQTRGGLISPWLSFNLSWTLSFKFQISSIKIFLNITLCT